jgi:hypothetical protein
MTMTNALMVAVVAMGGGDPVGDHQATATVGLTNGTTANGEKRHDGTAFFTKTNRRSGHIEQAGVGKEEAESMMTRWTSASPTFPL